MMAPVQCISVTPDGKRIGISALAYANNCFVFDDAGNLVFEDKMGHVNTLDLKLSADGKRTLAFSDGSVYCREGGGRWQDEMAACGGIAIPPRLSGKRYGQIAPLPHENLVLDPAGRYAIYATDGTLTVFDQSLALLWKFDEFDQYETSKEILFGRKAYLAAVLDKGDTLVYRLSGKALAPPASLPTT